MRITVFSFKNLAESLDALIAQIPLASVNDQARYILNKLNSGDITREDAISWVNSLGYNRPSDAKSLAKLEIVLGTAGKPYEDITGRVYW